MMKGEKGITLVALVITIIVMLILVAVSITVAIRGGLFDTARNAAEGTKAAAAEENSLASGHIIYKSGTATYNTTAEHIANGTFTSDPLVTE